MSAIKMLARLGQTNEKGRRSNVGLIVGGDEGDRTLDLRIANATLSQLSYVPRTHNYTAIRNLGKRRRRYARLTVP